tara:strand:- start:12363 stop:13640 length:1278 start_codon:yes stop_codon:yes gene_type:complete
MRTKLEAVRVQEIILNNEFNPKRYDALGGNDAIGTILYSRLDQLLPLNKSTDKLGYARPLFASITQYPIINEIVYLVKGPSSTYYDNNEVISYYLPAIKVQNHPLHNAFPNELHKNNTVLSNEESEADDKEEFTINLGEYFTELEKIRPLRPYEGDTIVEGRFGNSIRLGATTYNQLKDINRWSNEGEVGNPITIIRNGQREDEIEESFEHILEDVDNDNSSIYLCSDQQLTNFTPASIYTLSFGANLETIQKVETIISNEPIIEEIEEELPLVSPPPLPPEPEELPEEEVQEDIAEYDDAPSEEQVIFPGDDLGDLPENYENLEGIDVERRFGPDDGDDRGPEVHKDAIEIWDGPYPTSGGWDKIKAKGPYAFYNRKMGPFNIVSFKNRDMLQLYETPRSTGTIAEQIGVAKSALSGNIPFEGY